MNAKFRILAVACIALLGIAACGNDNSSASGSKGGSIVGKYVGQVPELGVQLEIQLQKDNKGILTFDTGNTRTDMDCTYDAGEKQIALNCLGSSGITLTKLDNGDMEGNMDGTIVHFKKS